MATDQQRSSGGTTPTWDDPVWIAAIHRPLRIEIQDPLSDLIESVNRTVASDDDLLADEDISERVVEIEREHVKRAAGRAGIVVADTSPDRGGIDDAIREAEMLHLQIIAIDQLSTLGRNPLEIRQRIRKILDRTEAELMIHRDRADPKLLSQDGLRVLEDVLDVLDESAVDLARETAISDLSIADDAQHRGRAPLGFDVECGELRPGANFDGVASALKAVKAGKISKRRAADELETSPRSITRALDRPARYDLD